MPPVVVPGPIDPVDAGMVGYRNEFDDMQAGESLERSATWEIMICGVSVISLSTDPLTSGDATRCLIDWI